MLQVNYTIMHILDDVCLLESDIDLAPPIVSMFECSSTWPASYEHSNSCEALEHKSWTYDWKPSLVEKPWRNNH